MAGVIFRVRRDTGYEMFQSYFSCMYACMLSHTCLFAVCLRMFPFSGLFFDLEGRTCFVSLILLNTPSCSTSFSLPHI